jgi:hypothetical protein
VPPDPVLWVEAAVHSEAIRPEHPTPKLVTDNLDNFSNRGDSHRLSTHSVPQEEATLTPSLAPTLTLLRLSRLPKLSVTEADQRREPRESILRSLICALVPNADRQDETVDAKADSRSKPRRENPL